MEREWRRLALHSGKSAPLTRMDFLLQTLKIREGCGPPTKQLSSWEHGLEPGLHSNSSNHGGDFPGGSGLRT